MPECSFCGQDDGEHTRTETGWFPVVSCPNIPEGWVAVGPDAVDGSLVVVDSGG